jgi:hypothetical protein
MLLRLQKYKLSYEQIPKITLICPPNQKSCIFATVLNENTVLKLRPARIRDNEMKKCILVLAVMLGFLTAAKAQTYIGDMSEELIGVVPSYFSSSGHPYLLYYSSDNTYSVYQSDFTTHLTDINFGDAEIEELEFVDMDVFGGDIDIILTQNLFNDDDYFEYFESEEEAITYYDTVWYWDYDYDSLMYEVQVYQGYQTTSIYVKSTNGSTVWSYSTGNGTACSFDALIKFDGKYYFTIRTYDDNGDRVYRLYWISQTEGVAEVKTGFPMAAFPTMPTRDQQITVELGEGNNAREITVVNELGQVVKRVPVQEGQREVVIPARDLSTGLNVLSARTKQGKGSCKIIVR